MLNSNRNPWTPRFQRELLVLLLQLPEAYGQYNGIWKPSYFDDVIHRDIAQAYLTVRDLGNDHPTKTTLQQELLKDCDSRFPLPADKAAAIAETEVLYQAQPQNARYSVQVVRKWAQDQELLFAVGECLNYLQAGEVEKIRPLIDKAYAVGLDAGEIGITVTPETRDPGAMLLETLTGDFLPIGMSNLDRVLSGGMRAGELITVVGIAGVFKSGLMLNWIMPALQRRKRVTWISLEMPEQQVFQRFCYWVSGKRAEILKSCLDEFNTAFNAAITRYPGYLHIKNFGNGTLDVAGLKAYLDQLDHREHETDLLVVDYPQIMKKPSRDVGEHIAVGDLYAGVRAIAIERQIPVIAAAQLNREAFKDPENITMDKIAASMDIARHSDCLIGIAQSEDMRRASVMRLKVLKNRNEETGIIVKVKVDYPIYRAVEEGLFNPAEEVQEETSSTAANERGGAGRKNAQKKGKHNYTQVQQKYRDEKDQQERLSRIMGNCRKPPAAPEDNGEP